MATKTAKITKRPSTTATAPAQEITESQAEKFINGAPDSPTARPARKGVQRGNREQISHTIPRELLDRLDESAQAKGLTRAGFINLAVSAFLDRDKQ